MRLVKATWKNDDGEYAEVMGNLSDKAIADLILFVEEADENEEYERGELLK